MPQTYIVIPARYQSTRLLGKPLLDIAGKPMIQRVYEQACKTTVHGAGARVIVATDHQTIIDTVTNFGGEALLTSSEHLTGTDRLAEVARQLNFDDDDIVINVQGDEPLIPPEAIDQVAVNLERRPQFDMATLATAILSENEFNEFSTVKVIADINGRALYFSRAAIPATQSTDRQNNGIAAMPKHSTAMRHIGIYAYRVRLLKAFPHWQQPSIEMDECLEQLRILYQGYAIHVEQSCRAVPAGIDTAENLLQIKALFLS